jgi:hypothetical protein
MIRGTMLTVDDPENPDRSGDAQGMDDIINGRAFGKSGNLFIGAELAQGCKKPDRNVHGNSIPDFPWLMECIPAAMEGQPRGVAPTSPTQWIFIMFVL